MNTALVWQDFSMQELAFVNEMEPTFQKSDASEHPVVPQNPFVCHAAGGRWSRSRLLFAHVHSLAIL